MINLYNYALLSELKNISGGNFTQIFCLFAKPIIADMHQGEIFNPEQFLEKLRTRYGIAWTRNILENIIPHLKHDNLITEHKIGNTVAYTCNVPSMENYNDDIVNKINLLVAEFKNFLSTNPSLTFSYESDNDLLTILTQYLSTNDWIGQEANRIVGEKRNEAFSTDNDYICARFISTISNPNLIKFLSELSGNIKLGVLLKDFSIPSGNKKTFAGQNIFLDNTLLLSFLGLCGANEEKAAKSLVNLLKDNGAKICVYSHTCVEATNALRSVLAHHQSERFGLTWNAIANGEIPEDYVDYAIRNFDEKLHENNFNIIETSNKIKHPNFSAIFSELNFLSDKPTARERDALSIFYMIHQNKLERKSDVLQLKNIFITTNPTLVSAIRRYLIENDATGYDLNEYANPFIVASKMEFLLWLIYGNEDQEAATIPTMQLICNADKVRRLKPEIFKIAQTKVATLEQQNAEKINAMLKEPRYKQALADITLNDIGMANSITANQILEALENENKKEIRALKVKHGKEISHVNNEMAATKALLLEKEEKDANRINRIMINTLNKRHRICNRVVSSTLIMLDIFSIGLGIWNTKIGVPLSIVFIISTIIYFISKSTIKTNIISFFDKFGLQKSVRNHIEKACLSDVLDSLEKDGRIDWSNYVVKDKDSLLSI